MCRVLTPAGGKGVRVTPHGVGNVINLSGGKGRQPQKTAAGGSGDRGRSPRFNPPLPLGGGQGGGRFLHNFPKVDDIAPLREGLGGCCLRATVCRNRISLRLWGQPWGANPRKRLFCKLSLRQYPLPYHASKFFRRNWKKSKFPLDKARLL